MTGDRLRIWLYGISLIVWIVSFTVWRWLGTPVFYIGTAFLIVGWALILYLDKTIPKPLSSFGFFVAANNFIDEIILDPVKLNLSEYLVCFIALIFYYKKYRKRK